MRTSLTYNLSCPCVSQPSSFRHDLVCWFASLGIPMPNVDQTGDMDNHERRAVPTTKFDRISSKFHIPCFSTPWCAPGIASTSSIGSSPSRSAAAAAVAVETTCDMLQVDHVEEGRSRRYVVMLEKGRNYVALRPVDGTLLVFLSTEGMPVRCCWLCRRIRPWLHE